jgi:hypothetical protein
MRLPIVLAAVIPLILVPETEILVGAVVDVVSWLVFLADLIVPAPTEDRPYEVLAREMAELRQQIVRLTERLGGGSSGDPDDAS